MNVFLNNCKQNITSLSLLVGTTVKWNIVLIQKVDILKMASKMAVSSVPITCLTNILDKMHFDFDFLWMFRG